MITAVIQYKSNQFSRWLIFISSFPDSVDAGLQIISALTLILLLHWSGCRPGDDGVTPMQAASVDVRQKSFKPKLKFPSPDQTVVSLAVVTTSLWKLEVVVTPRVHDKVGRSPCDILAEVYFLTNVPPRWVLHSASISASMSSCICQTIF